MLAPISIAWIFPIFYFPFPFHNPAVHLRPTFLLGCLALLVPAVTFAAKETTFDFTAAPQNEAWNAQGLDTAAWEQGTGLRIRTSAQGGLVDGIDAQRIDSVAIDILSAAPVQRVLFLWHKQGMADGMFGQSALTVIPGRNAFDVPLGILAGGGKEDGFVIVAPPGADFVLERVSFQNWTLPEKLSFAWKSFWTMDSLEPTGINFLWGPVIRFSPIDNIFDVPPPVGWSINRLFLGFLLLAAILIFILHKAGWKNLASGRNALVLFFALVMGCWVIFDLRMGIEFIRNTDTGVRTYLLEPVGKRQLFRFGNLYDAIERSVPVLLKHPTYGLLTSENGSPVPSRIRYLSYPSIPADPSDGTGGILTWFVYDRPDVTVKDSGALVSDGKVISPHGTILERFNASSFLYQATP